MEGAFSRMGYCPKCFREGRPKLGDYAIVKGGTSGKVTVIVCTNPNKEGITPHFWEFVDLKDGKVNLHKCCAMEGCGISLTFIEVLETGEQNYAIDVLHARKATMPISQYEALLYKTTDTGYEIDI